MTILAEQLSISWRCLHTWRTASKNTAWCLIGCVIGDFGTIAFFQFTGIPWPTLAIMSLAIVNGILTSIALETCILVRQMDLRTAFRTAVGMSLISMVSMEVAMNTVDVMLTGGAKTDMVGDADHVACRVPDATALQLLAAEGAWKVMPLRRFVLPLVVATAAGLGVALYLGESLTESDGTTDGDALATVVLPKTLSARARQGQRSFDANCAVCHGANAAGRDGSGPPLVHMIYEPGHHGDESFQRAVAMGVRAHHWRFGDMPRVEGLNRREVNSIVTYIRELQRTNGIE